MRRTVLGLAVVLAVCASCAVLGEDDPEIAVTVVRGTELAPPALARAEVPAAQHVPESGVLVFVSTPLYSGSCPPTAEAEQDEDGSVRLTIDDSHEGDCTADANRETFLIQGLPETPTRLVIHEDERDDIEIDLGS